MSRGTAPKEGPGIYQNDPSGAAEQRKPQIKLHNPRSIAQTSTLKFIDESERQNSSQIRREIRSHVRKGSHERQRRLNAVTKARPLSMRSRKILQKRSESEESNLSERLDRRTKDESAHHADLHHLLSARIPEISNDDLRDESLTSREPKTSRDGFSPATNIVQAPASTETSIQSPLELWECNSSSPYALLLGKDGPIFQIQRRTWPFANRVSEGPPGVSVWMPCSTIPMPNIRSPRPGLLNNSKFVPWIANSAGYYAFKEDIIKWVNNRLRSSEHATDEKTIGAIACLTSWELARGNTAETALHMDGLLRIVTLRGGLKEFCPIKQFCWKVHLIDLLVAVLTSTQPRFRDQNPQRPTLPPTLNLSTGKMQIADSPLYGNVSFETLLASSPFCSNSIELLQEMRDLTEGFRVASLSSGLLSSSGLTFRITRAASSIYRRAFMSLPVPFRSAGNAADVNEIRDALEDTSNDETWTHYPGILFWILLTALAAANDDRRCYIAMFMFRVGTTAVWWGTEEATAAVMTFLRVKMAAEGFAKREHAKV